jgi:hypothetical protein
LRLHIILIKWKTTGTLNNCISKYLNSNFGNYPGRLSDLFSFLKSA